MSTGKTRSEKIQRLQCREHDLRATFSWLLSRLQCPISSQWKRTRAALVHGNPSCTIGPLPLLQGSKVTCINQNTLSILMHKVWYVRCKEHTHIFHKCIRIYNVAWNSLWRLYAYMNQASNANFDNQMSATQIGHWESLWHREEAAPYMMHSPGLNAHEADMAGPTDSSSHQPNTTSTINLSNQNWNTLFINGNLLEHLAWCETGLCPSTENVNYYNAHCRPDDSGPRTPHSWQIPLTPGHAYIQNPIHQWRSWNWRRRRTRAKRPPNIENLEQVFLH